MTRLLTDVLRERADAAPGPRVDLDQVLGAGRRRVRRTRVTAGLATAAALTAVVGGASLVPQLLGPHDTALPADTPSRFLQRQVGYASEDVIRWGTESFSVGAVVSSYVQTDDGFVFATPNGDVWHYDGADSRRIGQAAGNRLRADDTGSLVAWVDRDADQRPQYVVYDTSARKEVARVDDDVAGPARPGSENEGGALVYAVDDGSVYWRAGEDIVRYDVATGDTRKVMRWVGGTESSARPQVIDLVDVAAGRLAYVVDGDRGSELKVSPTFDPAGPTMAPTSPTVALASHGFLSPDGRFLGAEENDDIAVYDTATGTAVTPGLERYPFAVVVGWVDDDTAMVFAISSLEGKEDYPFDMLSCDIPSGDCAVVSSGETPMDDEELFVPPVGDPMT